MRAMQAEIERLEELADQLAKGKVGTRPPLPPTSDVLKHTNHQLVGLRALVSIYEADPLRRRSIN